MESSEVEINMAIELDVPIQDRNKSDIDIKVKKDPCLRDLLTPINVGDLLAARIRDPIYDKPNQRPCKTKTLKGSEVELNIEAKAENIELVDVPIQNGIKFVHEIKFDKDLKDNFIVKSIIDEVIQNVIEENEQLDHGNVQLIASGKKHKFKIDTAVKEKLPYYCALCEVFCGCQNGFEKHLAKMTHIEKVNTEKEKHTYESWGNLDNTEEEKVIYFCALCQVSYGSQNVLEKHLVGINHTYKADPEKEKEDYYCALCQVSCVYKNGYVKHLTGKKHKEKVNKEEEKMAYNYKADAEYEKMTYYCGQCQVSCVCQKNLEKHLAGTKHNYRANKENQKINYGCDLCQVSCRCKDDLEKHLSGKKHTKKVNTDKEKEFLNRLIM